MLNFQFSTLSSTRQIEATSVFDELVKVIGEQARQLAAAPVSIPSSETKLLADRLNVLVSELDKQSKDKGKQNTSKLLETIRSSFGSLTDIVLNVVKLAQIGGSF